MKKLFAFFVLFAFLSLPLKALAAVDITLEDKSTTDQKSVSVLVDTGSDMTDTVGFQIQASDDVTISDVIDQNSTCSDFTYTNVSNLIKYTCTLSEPMAVNGYVATILFTSTSSDYTFTFSETNGLDLGELTLGTVTNIESDTETSLTEITTTPVTTQAATTETANTTSSLQSKIADYLPYILIGGAAILLISILGILFSKKKVSKPEEEVSSVEEAQSQEPTTTPLDNPPTDIDNISESLYKPEVSQPTIQEKLEPEPTIQQSEETSPAPSTQESDLAALIEKEDSESSTPQTSEIPEQDMTINNQVPPVTMPEESIPTSPIEQTTPPVQDMVVDNQVPPVIPTKENPTMPIEQTTPPVQNMAMDNQVPPVIPTEENPTMPEVDNTTPPTQPVG